MGNRKEKKILIDLTNYGNPTCGFGQIAANYAMLFAERPINGARYTYLLPNGCRSTFGNNVTCVPVKAINKLLHSTLPKVDLWHSVNQQQRKLCNLSKDTKFVFTVHDFNFLFEKNPAKAARYLRCMQKKIDRADAVTAISGYTADIVRRHIDLKGKEIQVIYNGVEDITCQPESKPAFATGRPFFFAIGQIRRKKNFHLLLDVMAEFPGYDLYICGDTTCNGGRYADEITSSITAKRLTNVYLTGTITQAEKVWLYRYCEAFLFPSQGEGFGLPAIEAMQFGKAVFAAARTSLPEICGGHAFLWEKLETREMVQSIRDNLPGFYYDSKRVEALKSYAATFSYERHVKAYIDLYCRLLGLDREA